MTGKIQYVERVEIRTTEGGWAEVDIFLSNGDKLGGLEKVQILPIEPDAPPRVDLRLLMHQKKDSEDA